MHYITIVARVLESYLNTSVEMIKRKRKRKIKVKGGKCRRGNKVYTIRYIQEVP